MSMATINPGAQIAIAIGIALLVVFLFRRVIMYGLLLVAILGAAIHFQIIAEPAFISKSLHSAEHSVQGWQKQEITKLVCARKGSEEANKETQKTSITANCGSVPASSTSSQP